ncbi:MAG: hypothetical protein N4A38_05795 [Candidatus Gracilibacteria bacterium]|nr:hypothetical protein [Candidatus Gracilibacteria bacterium]
MHLLHKSLPKHREKPKESDDNIITLIQISVNKILRDDEKDALVKKAKKIFYKPFTDLEITAALKELEIKTNGEYEFKRVSCSIGQIIEATEEAIVKIEENFNGTSHELNIGFIPEK